MTEVVLPNLTKEYLHNLGITIVCTLGQYSSPFNNQHQTAPPFSPIPPHQHPHHQADNLLLNHLLQNCHNLLLIRRDPNFGSSRYTGMYSKLPPQYHVLNIPHNFIVHGVKPYKIVSSIPSLISFWSIRARVITVP